jgi:hypothetical protein
MAVMSEHATDSPTGPQANENERSPNTSRFRHLIDYLKPAIIVAIIGATMYSTGLGGISGSGTPGPRAVEVGKDYYVTVALLEFSENDQNGEAWDHYNETGPDIYVEITWKGKRIYKSTTKEDSFVAKWSNAEFDLREMAIKGRTASMDDVIHAARVNIKDGEDIVVSAYDDDTLKSDLAGEKVIKLSELKVGDNLFTYDTPGIKRMILRISDMSEPVDVLQ